MWRKQKKYETRGVEVLSVDCESSYPDSLPEISQASPFALNLR